MRELLKRLKETDDQIFTLILRFAVPITLGVVVVNLLVSWWR